MKKQGRVLLALGWYDYRLHRGIGKFAQERGWHLYSDVTREKVIPWGWEGDGILAWLGAGDDLADFVVRARKPTVDFSFRRPNLPFPRVLVDHAACARLAAEHFLSHGLTNFIFYSAAENWAFEETGTGFVQALQDNGHECNWLRWHCSREFTKGKLQWQHKRTWLAGNLRKAPKPLAVFAATDDHALDVLETCESAGLQVPEEVSIIGMDNSLLAVDAMRIPISSVDTNLERVGYLGAELLDRLMRRKAPPEKPIRVAPAGLIARRSSDLIAVAHPGVARSLRFLVQHFHEPIGVEDLVRAAAMSRRGLHHAFLENLGRTPGSELHRVRIEYAKRLLASSAEKTDVVAEMCGYPNANSFWVAFRQATGKSPTQYRKEFGRHPGH